MRRRPAQPPQHDSRNMQGPHAWGTVRASTNGAVSKIRAVSESIFDRGSPGPDQYTHGWVVPRGVTRTVLTPHPPDLGGSPAIARTSGSPIAITSVFAKRARNPCQYSS